eukprot:1510282-Rhodomonas_salina.1
MRAICVAPLPTAAPYASAVPRCLPSAPFPTANPQLEFNPPELLHMLDQELHPSPRVPQNPTSHTKSVAPYASLTRSSVPCTP